MKRKNSYRATVSVLGGDRLGIHLPKDFRTAVGWERGTKLWITPLTKKKLVVEVCE